MHSSIEHYSKPFRTSSYSSAADNCVEVADGATQASVRDTKNRDLGVLNFSRPEWQAFLGTTKGA